MAVIIKNKIKKGFVEMKIVHLTSFPYIKNCKYQEMEHPKTWIRNLLTGLGSYKECVNVVIALTERSDKSIEFYYSNKVKYIFIKNRGVLHSPVYLFLCLYFIIKERHDVLHIHGTENLLQILILFFRNSTIVSVQGIVNIIKKYDKKNKYILLALLEKFTLTFSKYINVKSLGSKVFINEIKSNSSVFFIEPAIRRFELKAKSSNYKLIFIGPVIKRKGIEDFLAVLSLVKHKGVEGHIIGKVVDRNLLKESIEQYNIDESLLHIHGQLEYKQICNILCKKSIYLLTSHIENSSNSLLECLCSGIPSIAYDTGSTKSFIKDGENGYITSIFQYRLMSEKVDEIISDIPTFRRISDNAKNIFNNRFLDGSIAEKHISMYHEVISKK
jgi:glycosyltransferase involved in cell wall biosynthesis